MLGFLSRHFWQRRTRRLSGEMKGLSHLKHLTLTGVANMKMGFFSDMETL
jgi:hypothetical protein